MCVCVLYYFNTYKNIYIKVEYLHYERLCFHNLTNCLITFIYTQFRIIYSATDIFNMQKDK